MLLNTDALTMMMVKDSWYRLGINNSKLSICFYVFEHLILVFGWSCVACVLKEPPSHFLRVVRKGPYHVITS